MVDINNTQIAYSPQDVDNDRNGASNGSDKEFSFFGEDGFTFLDFVDMINPLQHIPVVATAYRNLTGDEIDPGSRLAGGTLFGGPIGLAASTFNVVLEHNTGKDMGDHVVAWFEGEEEPVDQKTMMAKNEHSPNVSSFAPIIPESEADAMAAGEASLRMAELQEFMNPALTKEVPAPTFTPSAERGAGSAGTWSPPVNVDHPFPTERAIHQKQAAFSTHNSSQTPVETPQTHMVASQPIPQPDYGFQAKQSHNDSLDALRAFARDMKAQQQEMKAAETHKEPQPVAAPRPQTATSHLSQTQDNAWFAQMMSQNMERYTPRPNDRQG